MKNPDWKSEKDFLKDYDPSVFERPSLAVDNVIFTVIDGVLQVLLVKRSNYPDKDLWSLVGGFVEVQKDRNLEETAKRKLFEKTAVKTPYLEQAFTVGNKDRDARGWSTSTVYFALIPATGVELKPGPGASDIQWFPIKNDKISIQKMAFDHKMILQECLERLKSKVLYTNLPAFLLPKKFTLSELQDIYEVILNQKLDTKAFRRRMLTSEILVETGEMKATGARPAMLYHLANKKDPFFFTRNIEGPHK